MRAIGCFTLEFSVFSLVERTCATDAKQRSSDLAALTTLTPCFARFNKSEKRGK